MILSDKSIKALIPNVDESKIEPCSLDFTLGDSWAEIDQAEDVGSYDGRLMPTMIELKSGKNFFTMVKGKPYFTDHMYSKTAFIFGDESHKP